VQVDSLGLTALSIYDQNKDERRIVISEGTNLIQNKYEVAVKLQDLQADPNSPLYSVKSFEELGLYPPHCEHR
jgi:ATP-dependent RNA helicase DDX19/DBP5